MGFEILCGFENEFFLLRRSKADDGGLGMEAVDKTLYSSTLALQISQQV